LISGEPRRKEKEGKRKTFDENDKNEIKKQVIYLYVCYPMKKNLEEEEEEEEYFCGREENKE
jgi:hypothetical protein